MRIARVCVGTRVPRAVAGVLAGIGAVVIGLASASRPIPTTTHLPLAQRERSLSLAAVPSDVAASSCAERVEIRLFFGLGTPDGTLSDEKWARFLTEVVTPRFPSGLTVVHADGQWPTRTVDQRTITCG